MPLEIPEFVSALIEPGQRQGFPEEYVDGQGAVEEITEREFFDSCCHFESNYHNPAGALADAGLAAACEALIHPRPKRVASVSLGELRRLPNEVIGRVITQLDLPSLARLRWASHALRTMVDSCPQYRQLVLKRPSLVHAALATRATGFSLGTLHESFTSPDCSNCNRAGSVIYLLTGERICHTCRGTQIDFIPISMSTFLFEPYHDIFPQSGQHAGMMSLAGRYSAGVEISRHRLFDRRDVWRQAHDLDTMDRFNKVVLANRLRRFLPPNILHMAIIGAPVFCPETERLDSGRYCRACTGHYWAQPYRKPVDVLRGACGINFSPAEFYAHLRQFGPVRRYRINGAIVFKHHFPGDPEPGPPLPGVGGDDDDEN